MIVAGLLIVMEEHEAFWAFTSLVQRHFPPSIGIIAISKLAHITDYFSATLSGLMLDQRVLR